MSTTDPNSPIDPPANSTPRAEGDKLAGCYALSRKLNVAGTEVWLAHDEVLGKDVSLHFVPDAVRNDSRALQELRQDIKRNRQLIHPHILRVYDLVEEPEWVAISMDTFEAESVAARLDKQAGKGSPAGEVQAWVEQLAHTLEEAHKINVLHRDLSPSNLYLTPAGKLLVANFGISRTIRDARTRAGAGESSAMAYESPQLLGGKAAARTDDVYSFGAVLYAVLTGKPPFTGPDLAQQVRAGVSPESLAALQNADLNVPANWRTTIAACLDKNPEARPQNATEVARRLATTDGQAAAAVSVPAKSPEPAPTPAVAAAAPVAALVESKPVTAAVESKPTPASVESKAAPAVVELKPASAAVEQKPAPAPETIKSTTGPAPASKAAEPLAKESTKEPQKESKKESAPPKPSTPSEPAPSKAPDRPLSKDFTPRLYPEESRFPVTGLAVAAVVIVVIAIIYHFAHSGKPPEVANPSDQRPEQTELRKLTTPAPEVASSTPAPKTSVAETTPPKAQTPPPVAAATPSPLLKAIAEKTAAMDKAKLDAEAAEKTHADLLKQQDTAQASLAAVQKSIEEKSASAKVLKKAADEAAAQRKKLEDDKKAADAAAAEAQKMAAEKARLADEKAKALLDLEKTNAEKMTAPEKTEAEIAALQKTLDEKQRTVDDGAKGLAQAEAAKKQKLAAVTDYEHEIERIKASDAEAQKQKQAAEAEKTKLDNELAEMQRAFKQKMQEIEDKRKQLENPGATAPAPVKTPQTPVPATPSVMVPSTTPAAALAKVTPKVATPLPITPIAVAVLTRTPAPLPVATPAVATLAAPTVVVGGNSLGMKFVPVGDVDFCIWQTRVKDFEVYAKAVNLKSTSWKGPGFKQGPDHPVVNVSWQDAIAFCKWLTDKEHKDNVLPANESYRLPTDLEWSKAVGLPEEPGKTPEMRDMGIPDVYPWGNQWPPPAGAGNYTGEETGSDVAIKGYDDGFAWTSPVGSFPPNKFGLYDMGGNVWQWCMDTWNNDLKAKVLRGASWYNGALKLSLLSSCRVHAAPDSSTDNYGFRIVRAKEDAKLGKK